MGVVYEAIQESLGRRVALKILPLHGRIDPVQIERFRLESRSAARLHHGHIVPVYGDGRARGSALLRNAVHPGARPGRHPRRPAPAPCGGAAPAAAGERGRRTTPGRWPWRGRS